LYLLSERAIGVRYWFFAVSGLTVMSWIHLFVHEEPTDFADWFTAIILAFCAYCLWLDWKEARKQLKAAKNHVYDTTGSEG